MGMRSILLLRHGPADQSAPDAFIGRTNPALTEQGREIARAAGRRLSHLQIGGVYTSPLIRCVQTGRLLGLENLPVETVEGLAERDFGAWEGRSRAECRRDEAAWAEFAAPDGAPPQGESVSAFHTRVIDAYNDLLDKTDDKPVILIVAHQSVICAIAADALGLGMEGAYHFRCMPGSLAQIDYADGFATLSRWNG